MTAQRKNFYEILEITPQATIKEIQKAYEEAKETYSPSNLALYSIFNEDETRELHDLIEEAYAVLSNPSAKKCYDLNSEFFQEDIELEKKTIQHTTPSHIPTKDKLYLENGRIIKPYVKNNEMEAKIKSLHECTGSFLQKVRNYKDISIQELSDISKISKTNILSIEREDFENLPVKVFTRGFALQLSRLLGLDYQKFSTEYVKLLK